MGDMVFIQVGNYLQANLIIIYSNQILMN